MAPNGLLIADSSPYTVDDDRCTLRYEGRHMVTARLEDGSNANVSL